MFGYFSPGAFANQPGLPTTAEEHARLTEPCTVLDDSLRKLREKQPYPPHTGPMLTMIDRITGYWPHGGRAGLGRIRAEKDVDPGAWFFRAHFFQDPVMPGSLGIEAMCQLLQWYLIDRGIGARFEPIARNEPLKWTYRGQIVPSDHLITIELEILEIHEGAAFADAWLWIDGRRIYRLERLGIRVVPDRT